MSRIQSLPPIVGNSPKILVLGTMPGSVSLDKQQYYCNPRNQFWTIVGNIIGKQDLGGHEFKYEERTQALIEAGVAVWDVLESCEREESSDSNIKEAVPNDIVTFLDEYPSIVRIGFNGLEAQQWFNRYIFPKWTNKQQIRCYCYFPSTSGANTHMTPKEKQDCWTLLFKGI